MVEVPAFNIPALPLVSNVPVIPFKVAVDPLRFKMAAVLLAILICPVVTE